MAALKRVAVFTIGNTLQLLQAFGLRRGFEQIGVESIVNMSLPSTEQLLAFIEDWKPDLIFEIDRSIAQLPDLKGRVRHAVWLQNAHSHGHRWDRTFGGDDLIYLHQLPESMGIDLKGATFRWLFFAADDRYFFPDEAAPVVYDAMLAGHLVAPIPQAVFEGTLVLRDRDVCSLGSILEPFLAQDIRNYRISYGVVRAFLLQHLRPHIPDITLDDIPDKMMEFFDELPRLTDRTRVADAMLRATRSVAFYGPPMWAQWPKYRPYYRGLLQTATDLAAAYRGARLTLHDSSSGMHHRCMEAMACGSPVLINHNYNEGTPCDVANYFEPGRDFLWYDPDGLTEVMKDALADPSRLKQIARNAARVMREKHLWRHRAQQIADDFATL